MKEKDKIAELMNDYQGLDEEQADGDLKLTSNYYSFILLLFLAIGIVIILYKVGFSSGGENTPSVSSSPSLYPDTPQMNT